MRQLSFAEFPLQTHDKIRYGDTDRQGHVNNATTATFLETGRVEVLYSLVHPILAEESSFVLASIKIDYLKEINWPGTVEIGTGIIRVGTSSIHVFQQIFQNKLCVAQAEAVSVQVSNKTGKSTPLTEIARQTLQKWLLIEPQNEK